MFGILRMKGCWGLGEQSAMATAPPCSFGGAHRRLLLFTSPRLQKLRGGKWGKAGDGEGDRDGAGDRAGSQHSP